MLPKNSTFTAGNTRSAVLYTFTIAFTLPIVIAVISLLESFMIGGSRYCMRSVRNHSAICLEKTEIKHTWEIPELSAQLPKSAAKAPRDTLQNTSPNLPPPYGVLLVPSPPPVGGVPPAPLSSFAIPSHKPLR